MGDFKTLKLDNQVCFSLYAASREVIKLYKPFLDKFGLTYTQYIVMLSIWEQDNISVKELGKKLHLDSGTLTPVIKKLESMNLVEKRRSLKDDRVVMVSLTEKGALLKAEVIEVPEQVACKLGTSISKDLGELKRLLDLVLQSCSDCGK